ncbi:MAG: hypothetical protein ACTSQI_07755 [Candidatus Helarchaeota archaeon]
MRVSKFIGKQYSRFSYAIPFFTMILAMFNTISLLSIHLGLDASILTYLYLFPILAIGAYVFGLVLDKSSILTEKFKQDINIGYRKLHTENIKFHEFETLKFKALVKTAMPDKYELFKANFEELYEEFKERWGGFP